LVARAFEGIETRDDLLERVVPGNRAVATVTAVARALERLRDAIRVVGDLDARLAARTEPALVDRMRRAAFELLGGEDAHDSGLPVPHRIRVGVHYADGQPASSRAQRTDARLPHRDARHDVLVGHEADERRRWVATTRERGAC